MESPSRIAALGAALLLVPLTGCAAARSSSRVTLPRVVGDRAAAATARLGTLGVKTVTLTQFSSQPRGTVIAQGEPAGAHVAGGTTIALTVSAGVARNAMPRVAGMRAAAAVAALRRLHLAVLPFTVFSEAPRGAVVSTFPGAGAVIPYDGQVRIDVSGGPPPTGAAPTRVPEVRGLGDAAAEQQLRARWLVPSVSYVRSSESVGLVVRQSVAPGTRVRLGTLVGLALSLGRNVMAATPVPYVVGRPSAAAAELLRSTGFHVRVVTQRSPAAPARSVIDEQPMGGTKAPAHAVVTIVIAA